MRKFNDLTYFRKITLVVIRKIPVRGQEWKQEAREGAISVSSLLGRWSAASEE